tara:strand:- start:771 stop:1535 length:765 start_codon:yes stop_codon:yes gene_type:complete
MLTRYIFLIVLSNLIFSNIILDSIKLPLNEEFIYKTKFKSFNIGKTKISIIYHDDKHENSAIITIESTSNRFIDMIYKLRHFSTIIVDRIDYSLQAITQKLQQGDYIDSYSAVIDNNNKQIFYYNTKKNSVNKKQDSKIINIGNKVYDPFGIVYHLRNLKLEIGNKYKFLSYSKKKTREIILSSINIEYIESSYYNGMCYIIVPHLENNQYLLKNQGEMKIWYTVDKPHIPIKIEQKMKHGIMELILEDYIVKK